MALQATDLILVNRGSLTYKMTGSTILDPINTAQATATNALNKANANEQAITNIESQQANVPTGSVFFTASPPTVGIPSGYLPCDGSLVSTTDYPQLFAAIRYTYGGSGNQFRVPDLRSRCVMGYDPTLSRGYGSYLESANKSHSHSVNATSGSNSVDHTHTVTLQSAGEHNHQYATFAVDAESATVGTSGYWQNSTIAVTNSAGIHTHSVTVGDNSVDHVHTLSFNTELSGTEQGRPETLNLWAIIRHGADV
jgi:microcystin-dependent protein